MRIHGLNSRLRWSAKGRGKWNDDRMVWDMWIQGQEDMGLHIVTVDLLVRRSKGKVRMSYYRDEEEHVGKERNHNILQQRPLKTVQMSSQMVPFPPRLYVFFLGPQSFLLAPFPQDAPTPVPLLLFTS